MPRILAAAVGCLLLLTGCGAVGTEPPPQSGGGERPYQGEIPEFTGPWADLLRQAYEYSTTDLQRRILDDGQITDRELSEVDAAFVECMANLGYDEVEFGAYGTLSGGGGDPDRNLESTQECTRSTQGLVNAAYWIIRRNPEDIDEPTLMADCLVKSGVVDKSYTARDYELNIASGEFPFDLDGPEFSKCVLDPLDTMAQ